MVYAIVLSLIVLALFYIFLNYRVTFLLPKFFLWTYIKKNLYKIQTYKNNFLYR